MSYWLDILTTAVHTPSPHNVQPWRIKLLSETEAELYIDPTRALPDEDTTGSFIILAMGMFIESLDILAKVYGLLVQYEMMSSPESIVKALGAGTSN
ncbi:MAG TPA: hypothetical protein VK612_01565 [Pyrinomonadaceae bacterium]|nr:hypothetical protein [Pyrinomonadaceae bacterium]